MGSDSKKVLDLSDPKVREEAIKNAKLTPQEENVLRMRYGLPLPDDAPLGSKFDK